MAKVSGERGGFNDRAIQAIATTTKKYVLIGLFNAVVDDLPDVDRSDSECPDARRKPQSKRACLDTFNRLRGEIEAIASVADLQRWGDDNGVLIATLPSDWQSALRFRYSEKLTELRPRAAVKTVVPAPKHSLKVGGIAERAMEARQVRHRSPGPSQPFLATKEGPRPLPPIDELPAHSAPPRDDGILPFLDRRGAEPSFVDLVTGGGHG